MTTQRDKHAKKNHSIMIMIRWPSGQVPQRNAITTTAKLWPSVEGDENVSICAENVYHANFITFGPYEICLCSHCELGLHICPVVLVSSPPGPDCPAPDATLPSTTLYVFMERPYTPTHQTRTKSFPPGSHSDHTSQRQPRRPGLVALWLPCRKSHHS